MATKSEELAAEIELPEQSPDTTHFSVIDSDGMAVSNTYTLEASWGSRIVVRGAGFVLEQRDGGLQLVSGRDQPRGTDRDEGESDRTRKTNAQFTIAYNC